MKLRVGVIVLLLSACASNPLPQANGVEARFDRSADAIEIIVSNAQASVSAELVSDDGARFALPLTVVSAPHVNYSAPPTLGLGIGGFGGGWGRGGFGTGLGVGVPLGGPRPVGVDDQYVAVSRFAAPPAYGQRWPGYHVEVHLWEGQTLMVPAPAPT